MKSEPVWPARNRGLTRARDHDVFGLQVAVHDAECVRGSHTIRNLAGEVDGFAYPERAAIEHGPQGLALHQLGDDIGAAGIGADVVNGDDIGMIQRRARALLVQSERGGGRHRRRLSAGFLSRPCGANVRHAHARPRPCRPRPACRGSHNYQAAAGGWGLGLGTGDCSDICLSVVFWSGAAQGLPHFVAGLQGFWI
jgi:hypothetical protein